MAFLMGIACTHLVKNSVAVKIQLCFPKEDGFISPIKCRPHCWKGALTAIGFKGNDNNFCLPTNLWQGMHALTYWYTYVNKEGQ